MASDTTFATAGIAVDDCGGFVEPADILSRLAPDDVHPASLAGPHAWHPWGLTVAPPTDRHLRLVLPAGTRPDTADLVLERLQRQLGRTPWPPDSLLDVRRHDNRLDCRDDGRRSLTEVTVAADGAVRDRAEVVTRDGWPILGELDALNDRIRCIDLDEPSRTDLADLANWVEHKMTEPRGHHHLVAAMPQLLDDQARDCPSDGDRLRTILTKRDVAAGHPTRVLGYLAEQLDHCRTFEPRWAPVAMSS